jgi:hypothetical protein
MLNFPERTRGFVSPAPFPPRFPPALAAERTGDRPGLLAVQAVLDDQGVRVVGGEVAAAGRGVERVGGVVESGDGDAGVQ